MMLRSRLTGGVTIAALSRLASLFIGFFFQILVAKALPADEYASYAVALAVSVVVVTLLSLGITRALPRFLPLAIAYGTARDLRRTTAGYLTVRLAGLMLISAPLWIMHEHYASFLWKDHVPSRVILLSWIIVQCCQMDFEATSQALMEHRAWALTSFLELATRTLLTFIFAQRGQLDLINLITIWMSTSCAQLIIGLSILHIRRKTYRPDLANVESSNRYPGFGQQFKYSASLYVSAIAWLISSPSVMRLASATDLPVVPLAAFSFMQTLVNSAQRGLPVNLLATAIEPLVVTKSIVSGERAAAERALSLLIKLETIIILFGVVIIAPCSSWVVVKLGKPEFAAYGFVLPILIIQGLGGSYYRILETVAGIAQIHITFLAALPISIAALFFVYETTASLGITALLIWPSIETLARLAIVVYALRLHGVTRVFDFPILALLLLIATLLICLMGVFIWHFALGDTGRLISSLAGGVIFVLLLFVVRPFSGEEHRIFIEILKPKSLAVLRLSRHLTR